MVEGGSRSKEAGSWRANGAVSTSESRQPDAAPANTGRAPELGRWSRGRSRSGLETPLWGLKQFEPSERAAENSCRFGQTSALVIGPRRRAVQPISCTPKAPAWVSESVATGVARCHCKPCVLEAKASSLLPIETPQSGGRLMAGQGFGQSHQGCWPGRSRKAPMKRQWISAKPARPAWSAPVFGRHGACFAGLAAQRRSKQPPEGSASPSAGQAVESSLVVAAGRGSSFQIVQQPGTPATNSGPSSQPGVEAKPLGELVGRAGAIRVFFLGGPGAATARPDAPARPRNSSHSQGRRPEYCHCQNVPGRRWDGSKKPPAPRACVSECCRLLHGWEGGSADDFSCEGRYVADPPSRGAGHPKRVAGEMGVDREATLFQPLGPNPRATSQPTTSASQPGSFTPVIGGRCPVARPAAPDHRCWSPGASSSSGLEPDQTAAGRAGLRLPPAHWRPKVAPHVPATRSAPALT